MHVFKLVNGGFVDKVIAFRSLPESLVKNIRTRDIAGLPRYWAKWLVENGSVRKTFKTETEVLADRNLKVTKSPIGEEPCFYLLDYKDTNSDKDAWQEITNYVRRVVEPTVRLLDRIEDMAKKMAPDSHAQIDLEPEDVPVIDLPEEVEKKVQPSAEKTEIMTMTGDLVKPEPKRRGRPKKVAVEV